MLDYVGINTPGYYSWALKNEHPNLGPDIRESDQEAVAITLC